MLGSVVVRAVGRRAGVVGGGGGFRRGTLRVGRDRISTDRPAVGLAALAAVVVGPLMQRFLGVHVLVNDGRRPRAGSASGSRGHAMSIPHRPPLHGGTRRYWACSTVFSPPQLPDRGTASTPPVSEFRRYSSPPAPDSSRALTTRSSPSALSVSLVPDVR